MASPQKPTLGILGTGHLATYTVTGLRHSHDNRHIIVSPRNAARADNLKQHYGCEIARDNQTVIDNAEIILLAVRPEQFDNLLKGLNFPAHKTVVSAIAGVNLSQLRKKIKLPEDLALILPGVAAENAKGMVPVYPSIGKIIDLVNSLGEAITFESETQFTHAATMACLNGWLYRFFEEQVNWLSAHHISPETARNMVLQNTLGAAHYALGRPDQNLESLYSEIAKDGTYTKIGLDQLNDQGAFKQWSDALETIKEKFDAE